MATILYDLEFIGNKLAGYSILKNPWELIGLAIILIAMIIVAFLAQQMFKSYNETKMKATLYWALAFFFLLIAVIFLIIEKVSYSTLGNANLGDLMAILALITSGTAIVCFDIFSFHTTYPERVTILTIFVSILAAIYVGSLCFAIIQGYPWADVQSYELVYNPMIDIIVYCTLMPIILIAPIIFFYYASRMHEENPPNSRRSNWIGIGLLCFATGYIAEVAPFMPPTFSIPFRIFFVLAGYILWICFSMPDWFKSRIGWIE
ncbi:MAG: hypothetical protein ACTSO9_18685 [Candidatus Helarchaeota archaeon]